jgi:hypothetical protein
MKMCCRRGWLWKPQALRLWSRQLHPNTRRHRTGNRRLEACGGVSFSLPERSKLNLRRGEPGGFFEDDEVVVRSKVMNRWGEPSGVQSPEETRNSLIFGGGFLHIAIIKSQ